MDSPDIDICYNRPVPLKGGGGVAQIFSKNWMKLKVIGLEAQGTHAPLDPLMQAVGHCHVLFEAFQSHP